ncbi:OsmC family protein [soil metagenome]
MKIANITYAGGLRTEATHVRSGKIILTDAPPDNNGKGEAFSPTDLMAASLGSCMLTVMGIVAERHQLDITGTQVGITKIMDANPRRVVEIKVDMTFPKREFSDKDKQLLENTALTCPVAKSLHPDLLQSVTFTW